MARLISTIQSGQHSHTVLNIVGKLICKQFTSIDSIHKELWGTHSWRKSGLAKFLAKKYIRVGRLSLIEFLQTEGSYTQSEIANILAEVYSSLIANYQSSKSLYPQPWFEYVAHTIFNFARVRSKLDPQLTPEAIFQIDSALTYIQKIDWTVFPKLPLHRDLHVGNVLKTHQGAKIIDFEHSQTGPLEYEFCNSIFWDDSMSLDIRAISTALRSKGIFLNLWLTYNLTFLYFAEQYLLAKDHPEKQKQLISKLISFLDRYNRHYQVTQTAIETQEVSRLTETELSYSYHLMIDESRV